MNQQGLLQGVYLFKTLSQKELGTVVALGQIQTFNEGDTVFIRGEPAKALYLIKYGSIKIQQSTETGDTLDVAILGAGSHFGEMALVDAEPRSATAVAAERTELFVIPYEKLNMVLNQDVELAAKFYREMTHFLCGRLRRTTSDLRYAREKNLSHM